MNLDSILLGMLAEPASGYDLGREFEQSAALFWFAELSQIYPALRRLERRGLLSSEEVASTRGPPRRIYRRTAAGDDALEAALRTEPRLGLQRLPHVAQFYFMGELENPETASAFLDSLEAELRIRLDRFEAIESRMRECSGEEMPSDDGFYHHATLRMGLLVAEARLAWCRETRSALERRPAAGVTQA